MFAQKNLNVPDGKKERGGLKFLPSDKRGKRGQKSSKGGLKIQAIAATPVAVNGNSKKSCTPEEKGGAVGGKTFVIFLLGRSMGGLKVLGGPDTNICRGLTDRHKASGGVRKVKKGEENSREKEPKNTVRLCKPKQGRQKYRPLGAQKGEKKKGNGGWAKKRGKPSYVGKRKGGIIHKREPG